LRLGDSPDHADVGDNVVAGPLKQQLGCAKIPLVRLSLRPVGGMPGSGRSR
jgi:hypothetical protein